MVETRLGRRASVAVVAAQAEPGARIGTAAVVLRGVVAGVEAGEALDDAGPGVDAPDVVRPLAGQVDVAIAIDGDAAGGVELRLCGGPAVSAPADLPEPAIFVITPVS